jgi:hypothetical protein
MKKIICFTLCVVCLFSCFIFSSCEKECIYCNNGADLSGETYLKKELSTTATCTKDGKTTYQCLFCDRTAEVETKALGHDFKITKDEATCLNDGNTYYTCSRDNCGETKVEFSKASKSKHSWVETYSKETIQYIYSDYKCSLCQETKTEKYNVNMGTSIKNTEEEFYYATGAALRIVKEKLKYPSSAKFIKESQMEVHHNYSTGYYYIEGAVSAPNAFGVYTDFYFIVKTKIRVSGDKITWHDYDCVLEEG